MPPQVWRQVSQSPSLETSLARKHSAAQADHEMRAPGPVRKLGAHEFLISTNDLVVAKAPRRRIAVFLSRPYFVVAPTSCAIAASVV